MSKWDERYLGDDYVFGTEPAEFIKQIAPQLPTAGKALDLATGEGRNGIFLASLGLDVEGVDLSEVGLAKAQRLADEKGATFHTRMADVATMEMKPNTAVMQKIVHSLQPGGMFAAVFYHPNQIAFATGGPSDPAMLGTLEEMQAAINGLEWQVAEHCEHELHEGVRHKGMSSVIYLLGRKPL